MNSYSIKFPCGFEVNNSHPKHYINLNELFNDVWKKGCPIHGKRCKQ